MEGTTLNVKLQKPEASCGYVSAYSEAVSMLSSITEAWSVLGLPIRLNSDSFSLETEAQTGHRKKPAPSPNCPESYVQV